MTLRSLYCTFSRFARGGESGRRLRCRAGGVITGAHFADKMGFSCADPHDIIKANAGSAAPESAEECIVGGMQDAKSEVESEHRLHIRAAAGEPAAHLPLRHDHGGGTHGQVKDNGQINMALCCDFRCGTSHRVIPILSLMLVVHCVPQNFSTGLDK